MANNSPTILITNTQFQTFPGTLYSIRQVFNGKIISVSPKEYGVGVVLSDRHYTILNDDPNEYIKQIINVCDAEHVSVIIPLSIKERLIFLKNKSLFNKKKIKIFSSSEESIVRAENKMLLFELCEKNNIPSPHFYVVDNFSDLKERATSLGYPQKKVVVKPVQSSGSRGLRILNKKADYKKQFYRMRADYTEITLSDLKTIVGKQFQPLIISEYLPGEEFTVDCLRHGSINFAFPRVRTEVKNGVTFMGEMREHKSIIDMSKKLAGLLDLTTVFGFQFKLDSQGKPVIIDCNPRIQGTMIMSTLAGANIIAAGVKLLIGQSVGPLQADWTMKYYRFWSGVSLGQKKRIVNF